MASASLWLRACSAPAGQRCCGPLCACCKGIWVCLWVIVFVAHLTQGCVNAGALFSAATFVLFFLKNNLQLFFTLFIILSHEFVPVTLCIGLGRLLEH